MNHLQSALRKSRIFRPAAVFKNTTMVGYLTPVEILALLDDGARLEHPNAFPSREYCEKHKKAGHCSPTWFYYHPGNTGKVEPDRRHDPSKAQA
jgi:hypothetical protein